MSSVVEKVLGGYRSEPPSILAKLRVLMNSGSLSKTGKLLVYPVDQGFEHGPEASFSVNTEAYDPEYHINLALEAGFSAYAAPLGMIEAIAADYSGTIPMILKLNSSNSFSKSLEPDQAVTASVRSALNLGCSGVGITIYPGSNNFKSMLEYARRVIEEAKSLGLFSVVWAYPRGAGLSKEEEVAIDVVSYAAHISALIGAHIIKVKLPEPRVKQEKSFLNLERSMMNCSATRVSLIMRSAFDKKRMVLFSGGAKKDDESVLSDIRAISEGGGSGSIVGRNIFQRERGEAINMVKRIVDIYKSGAVK